MEIALFCILLIIGLIILYEKIINKIINTEHNYTECLHCARRNKCIPLDKLKKCKRFINIDKLKISR